MSDNTKQTSTPIVTINMNEDHRLDVEISKDIGMIMNDDADHDNSAARKAYASEALVLALATNAKELVNEGVSVEEVMARILDSIADNLAWALDIDIKVHPMIGGPTKDNHGENFLS